jgi:hypothetical protein
MIIFFRIFISIIYIQFFLKRKEKPNSSTHACIK